MQIKSSVENKIIKAGFTYIAFFILFLYKFSLSISTEKRDYKIKYNGIMWCAMDYYTIVKYNSSDSVIKWVELRHTKHL